MLNFKTPSGRADYSCKPFSSLRALLALLPLAVLAACGSSLPAVETTAAEEWTHEFRFAADDDFFNQAYLSDDGQSIALISPRGFEAVDAAGGVARISSDRESFWATYTETSRGTERINQEKVNFIYVPYLHAVLEFNYGRRDESISLIDLATGETLWVNESIRWSHERYQLTARALAFGLGVSSTAEGAAASDVASQIAFPEVYLEEVTTLVPELNALLIQSTDGLAMVSLETGETLWTNDELKGGVAALLYHEPTHSVIFVNSDTGALQVEGFQFVKELARLSADTGDVVWKRRYNGDIRHKVNGFGQWEDREIDIRLMDDFIVLNFLNLEVYDVNTGEEVIRTTTGADRALDLIAPEAQIMNFFAFPVTDGEMVYRVKHGNVRLSGIDVEMEAFDLSTGERLWETGKLSSNNRVVDMLLIGDRLIAGFDENGSREGVAGLHRDTGEQLWKIDLGRGGVTVPFMWHEEAVWVVSGRRLLVLNPFDGEVWNEYAAPESIGRLEDVRQIDDKVFLLGNRGLAVMSMRDGALLAESIAPGANRVYDFGSVVMAFNFPEIKDSPVHTFDRNGTLLSSVRGASRRSGLLIAADGTAVYAFRGGRVTKYRTR